MTQNYTILFDLDGTLVDTAPDLMNAHNHVMTKYGYGLSLNLALYRPMFHLDQIKLCIFESFIKSF